MISRIRVRGLGPHVDATFALDPTGVVEIAGPSASGKSLLIDAVCFVFWGLDRFGKPFPLDAISSSVDLLEVELTTAKGTRLCRTMRRSRTRPISACTSGWSMHMTAAP